MQNLQPYREGIQVDEVMREHGGQVAPPLASRGNLGASKVHILTLCFDSPVYKTSI